MATYFHPDLRKKEAKNKASSLLLLTVRKKLGYVFLSEREESLADPLITGMLNAAAN
jgi:hypothetical protein